MWKCLNCGTDNEYNFCTNCQISKEESGLKTPTSEQEWWECSRCGAKIDGNFCGQCRMSRAENDAWQQPPHEQAADQQLFPEQMVVQQPSPKQMAYQQASHEQVAYQQPFPEQTAHQPPLQQSIQQQPAVAEKSGKKGVIIAIVAVVAIVVLLVTVVVFAMRLILNNDGDDARDSDPETYIEEEAPVEEAPVEEAQVVMIDSDGPYRLDVWGESNVMELENDSIVLEVPLPPEITTEEVELTGSTLTFAQGEGAQWLFVWIELGDRQLEDDFREYSDVEVNRALRDHGTFGEVLDYYVFEERNVTLLIIHWEDGHGEGISFVKISETQGYLLVTEIGFESLEDREDFFEAYGFNDYFESIIQEVVDEWEAGRADSSNQEQDEDRGDVVQWTAEQRDSWADLRDEFWDVSDLAFDLFFFVWDYVIIENTIHQQYPNADVERLTRLHTEFDERFDELNVFPEVDQTLPYDGEHNQNVFQETRELIQEFERIYSDFRAALEGR